MLYKLNCADGILVYKLELLVLVKITIVVWYNWRIVYKLSFKRRHAGEVMSLHYHPVLDLVEPNMACGLYQHQVKVYNAHNKDLVETELGLGEEGTLKAVSRTG